jgi:hypothetical protein
LTISNTNYSARLEICKSCEFFDQKGYWGTGKCKKCGCSLRIKLKLAKQKCPIGKWEPHLTSPPN